jgi:hypothetical protein
MVTHTVGEVLPWCCARWLVLLRCMDVLYYSLLPKESAVALFKSPRT